MCLVAGACREEGAVQVKKLSFTGVTAVEESRLRGALATRQGSRLPWGRKYSFDRGRFDADLKRIEAFYADRGYPDARVTGFDVQLNDAQDEVDMVWIREPFLSDRRDHGRLIVHGHTPLSNGSPDFRSNRLNLDTGAGYGGPLTAAVFSAEATPPLAFLQVE